MAARLLNSVSERIIDSAARDGSFQIAKTQDCENILAAIKATSDIQNSRAPNTQNSHKYLGSVPTLIAVEWAKEWGVPLNSKAWLEKARHRLKTDPNWRRLCAPK